MKKVFVIYWPGINCEEETMAAFRAVGADPQLVFVRDLISGKIKITDCDLICFPGGFSYGDHIDTGIVAAVMIQEFIQALLEAKIPGIFICNGFQIAVRAGIFGNNNLALVQNDSGVFCSRPAKHFVEKSNCLWTAGLEGRTLKFPAAHHAGKVTTFGHVNRVMRYEGLSPNGGEIAAVTNPNGALLGIMDHPERPIGNKDVLEIFRNGIKAV